ncbi:pentatricopeptide repeat-containing protein At3g53170 [Syzygium oleosum]|uniref:pentatricopeptide repeat-containing protein At3g53170 n=1 Tax=Syzygium oleosum TaxID=219896 RepID=UPI0011D1944F|nr:pentatricopeptide repeat-containing protein At3g53170 [Syzygium oleosum]
MRPFSLDTTDLRFSSQVSTTPTSCSTKFRSELRHTQNPSFILCQVSKRSSSSGSVGLQRKTQKDLSRILRTESAIKEIERKANSKKYNNLWPKAVLEALDEAIRENRYESALKIFGLLRKQHWYEPRCQTYTKLLMMLGKCRQPEQAGLLFELMLVEGLKPTLDVYTALVSAYGHSGRIDEALSTLEAMKSVSDCKPDVYTYSILVNCCMKFRQFDLIEQILSEMSYLGISCSIVTYNTMVDGYGKAEMFEQMEKSLTDMIDSGSCLPDVFTLNSVVGAYGKSGQIDKMEKWYEEFQLMGIRPDIITFNTLIGSYGKAGLYEKMSSVFYYMEKRFCSPTTTTYNAIIDIYGKAGDVEKMEEYFKKMKHRGMKPTPVTYCSLVSAYSKSGLIMKVDSILRQVDNSDVVLDTPFFNCIISAYGQAGDIEKMRELFLLMKERNCSPDTITYATMIQTYNALGMTEVAEDLENNIIRTKDHPGLKLIGC